MATLTEELTHLHEPFSKRRSLYKDRAAYERLIAQRHGLLVRYKGADASWGWGACRPCKLKGRSFTECRSSGGLTLNHGPEKPDAGATLAVGSTVRWQAKTSSAAKEGVIVRYDAAHEEHTVLVGGVEEIVNLVSVLLRVTEISPGALSCLRSCDETHPLAAPPLPAQQRGAQAAGAAAVGEVGEQRPVGKPASLRAAAALLGEKKPSSAKGARAQKATVEPQRQEVEEPRRLRKSPAPPAARADRGSKSASRHTTPMVPPPPRANSKRTRKE